jgi:leucyl/phenylalanyl-tRNA--protein transferase
MFAWRPDASKVAFVHLVRTLHAWHFHFVDCQTYSDHLAHFGAVLWRRERFLQALAKALHTPTRRGPWRGPEGGSHGEAVVNLSATESHSDLS